ncbi:hypothetical protein DL89DRAFT_15509 [Linderina pennispora]|uniref:Uncharacterized protein n=1 Tax=Linderina pennispora TaxID=61395 RepID=A0A1Y1WM86_9FUNG|nr:uncharacterized protein DL89DRAFT_15509 [Linderina pennispora]ORX74398.1 hypothetical protein DL89DRAFT_15509 [Linderina pennispora]
MPGRSVLLRLCGLSPPNCEIWWAPRSSTASRSGCSSSPGRLRILEPTREDYGQVAIYRGTIEGQRARMRFDNEWAFEAQRPVA